MIEYEICSRYYRILKRNDKFSLLLMHVSADRYRLIFSFQSHGKLVDINSYCVMCNHPIDISFKLLILTIIVFIIKKRTLNEYPFPENIIRWIYIYLLICIIFILMNYVLHILFYFQGMQGNRMSFFKICNLKKIKHLFQCLPKTGNLITSIPK